MFSKTSIIWRASATCIEIATNSVIYASSSSSSESGSSSSYQEDVETVAQLIGKPQDVDVEGREGRHEMDMNNLSGN